MVKTELKLTGDGSHTLYIPEFNEHYHSTHGAIQESLHVFINAGLKACQKKQLNILEIGFGTGLNALLTIQEAKASDLEISYVCFEPYPLPDAVWQQLNYPDLCDLDTENDIYAAMHKAPWNKVEMLNKRFKILKKAERIEHALLPATFFDLIYFDAFAPAVQAELWTFDIFNKLFSATQNDGILVTYSAMGEVRRNLMKSGFKVERLPGPPGKREMLRARKD